MARYQTQQRRRLLVFLSENPDRMFSARELWEELNDASVSQSAVYRNLAELEQSGEIARVVRAQSREVCYRSLRNEACRGRFHLTCLRCGKTIHMNAASAGRLLREVGTVDGFAVDAQQTTLYGLCADCR